MLTRSPYACRYLFAALEAAPDLFERLLALRNDVGLLAEEWDPRLQRQLGNTPQAFSHLALVGTALALAGSTDQLVEPG